MHDRIIGGDRRRHNGFIEDVNDNGLCRQTRAAATLDARFVVGVYGVRKVDTPEA